MKSLKNIFAIFIAFLLLVSTIAGVAALDIQVTSQAPTTNEGKFYKYKIQVNTDFDNVEFTSLATTATGATLNKTTGELTWNVPISTTGKPYDQEFVATIVGSTGATTKTIKHKFNVTVNPALNLNSIKIAGKEITDKTNKLSPGDKIRVDLTIKNEYTSLDSKDSLLVKDVNPALGAIKIKTTTRPKGFPIDINAAVKLGSIDLQPTQSKTLSFDYTIPSDITAGEHTTTFLIEGEDYNGNVYKHEKSIKFVVERESYDIVVSELGINNNEFSCQEKTTPGSAQIYLKLENIGNNNVEVGIDAYNNQGEKISKNHLVSIPSSNTVATKVELDTLKIKELVGTETIRVKIYDSKFPTIKVYKDTTLDLKTENCDVTFTQTSLSITGTEDQPKKVSLKSLVFNTESKQSLSFSAKETDNVNVQFIKENKEDFMIITPTKDFFGKDNFKIEVSDGYSTSTLDVLATFIQDKTDDNANIKSKDPNDNKVYLKTNNDKIFKIEVNNPDNQALTTKWYIGSNKVQESTSLTYTYKNNKAQTVDLKVELYDSNGKVGTSTWEIVTVDKPLGMNQFTGSSTTDLSKVTDLSNIQAFTLENSYGKIVFEQNVDISNIIDLTNIVKIEQNLVAIDSSKAPSLNKIAKITLQNTGITDVIIKKSSSFGNSGTFTDCTNCNAKVSNGIVTFTANSFSTYKAIQKQPAKIEVSKIKFDNIEKEVTTKLTIELKNTGSDPATDITLSHDIDSEFKPKLSTTSISSIGAGSSINVELEVYVPKDEETGEHQIGDLTLKYKSDSNKEEKLPILINPSSKLKIEEVEINGKTSGNLDPNGNNEIEVKVENNHDEDLENVIITIIIEDVDGDDLEEETEEFDLNNGDDEKVTINFDLSNEKLNKESYTIKVIVEGEGEHDGITQKSTWSKEVDVDRESHEVIIKRIELSPSELTCSNQANLVIELENVGKKDEDNVEIRITNTALNVDLKRSNIKLDKYSDNDNEYKATFSIFTQDANVGKYPISIEVLRDGSTEQLTTQTLEIKSCGTTTSSTTTSNTEESKLTALAEQLKKQIEEQQNLNSNKEEEQKPTIIESSFMTNNSYTFLLAVLVGLLFVGVILAMITVVKKK